MSEDLLEALFDLSDRAAETAPGLRRRTAAAGVVIVVLLGIIVLLLLGPLARHLVDALLALGAIVLGAVALTLLAETDRFYRSYVERHRAIRRFADAEAAPAIPAGPTPVVRLARHLAASNERIGTFLRAHPEALRYRVRVASAAGGAVPFDLAIVAPAALAYRLLGLGDPGFAVLARFRPGTIDEGTVSEFARDVAGVARRLPARPSRAILLRPATAEPMAEAVRALVGAPAAGTGARPGAAIEIISERSDGTYDLVPPVVGIP